MRRRHVSRRQTPATGTPQRIPDTFREGREEGQPVHAVQYAAAYLHAPCGASTMAHSREMDRRCPPDPTCRECIAWLDAQATAGEAS